LKQLIGIRERYLLPAARAGVNFGRHMRDQVVPRRRRALAATQKARQELEVRLQRLAESVEPPANIPARVLVDGQFDNPNYWFRYAVFRAALGLARAQETVVVGPWRRRQVRHAATRFGFDAEFDNAAAVRRHLPRARELVTMLLRDVNTPGDLLDAKLPGDHPAVFLYDFVLRRQRTAVVDLDHPCLFDDLAKAMANLLAGEEAIRTCRPEIVVLSQVTDTQDASIAWFALRAGIPTYVLYGYFGIMRFVRMKRPGDIHHQQIRAQAAVLQSLTPAQQNGLAEIGMRYVEHRLHGRTGDLGTYYAARTRTETATRADLVKRFGWRDDRPLIAVYAANWYDYPHSCGMENFRDYADWADETVARAVRNNSANWLFKPHPCEAYYGGLNGPGLADRVAEANAAHLAIVPQGLANHAVLNAIDGVVTFQGTVGLEASCLGIPTLVADSCWYGDGGFAMHFPGREGYLAALSRRWWEEAGDMSARTRAARVFAGLYFALPEWQGTYVHADDSHSDALNHTLPDIIARHADAIANDIRLVRDWAADGETFFHVFKMRLAEAFTDGLASDTKPGVAA
jgi:hypothetical protein